MKAVTLFALYHSSTILGLSSNTTILVKTPCHSQGWSTILILPSTHSRSRRLYARDAWPPSWLQLQATCSVEHLEPILQCRHSNPWIPFHDASDYSNHQTGLDKKPLSQLFISFLSYYQNHSILSCLGGRAVAACCDVLLLQPLNHMAQHAGQHAGQHAPRLARTELLPPAPPVLLSHPTYCRHRNTRCGYYEYNINKELLLN